MLAALTAAGARREMLYIRLPSMVAYNPRLYLNSAVIYIYTYIIGLSSFQT